jgi:hypothetical protein
MKSAKVKASPKRLKRFVSPLREIQAIAGKLLAMENDVRVVSSYSARFTDRERVLLAIGTLCEALENDRSALECALESAFHDWQMDCKGAIQ